jgi:TPR repeat protein
MKGQLFRTERGSELSAFIRITLIIALSACLLAGCSTGKPEQNSRALLDLQSRAEHGDRLAYLELADMYEDGRGVAQDDIEALKYYILGLSYLEVEGMARDYPTSAYVSQTFNRMTPAQREEAKQRAAAWKPISP